MTARNSLPPLLAVTVLLCGFAQADDVDVASGASSDTYSGSYQHPFGDSDSAFAHFGDELGLTGQQRTDIQIIIADYMPRYRDLAQLGRDSAAGLLRLAPDSPEYVDETQKASAMAASSAAELVTLLSEMRAKLYAVLSAEQRQKLQALIESRREHAGEDSPQS